MIPDLPDQAIPTWLSTATPESDALPIRSMLAASVYYPASGLDRDPIKWLAKYFKSFVYADYGFDRETVIAALSSFHGCEVHGFREVAPSEFSSQGLLAKSPWEDVRYGRQPLADFVKPPFAIWAVLQRASGFVANHGPDRLSLLFIGGDGVATFDTLYRQNLSTPAVVALIQPGHGFGGNWTNFTDPDGPLARTVMENPAGTPTWLLEGGMGDETCYERPCWSSFSTPVWSGRRSTEGTLRLWHNSP